MPSIVTVWAEVLEGGIFLRDDLDYLGSDAGWVDFPVEEDDKTRRRSPGGKDCFVTYANRLLLSEVKSGVEGETGVSSCFIEESKNSG